MPEVRRPAQSSDLYVVVPSGNGDCRDSRALALDFLAGYFPLDQVSCLLGLTRRWHLLAVGAAAKRGLRVIIEGHDEKAVTAFSFYRVMHNQLLSYLRWCSIGYDSDFARVR